MFSFLHPPIRIAARDVSLLPDHLRRKRCFRLTRRAKRDHRHTEVLLGPLITVLTAKWDARRPNYDHSTQIPMEPQASRKCRSELIMITLAYNALIQNMKSYPLTGENPGDPFPDQVQALFDRCGRLYRRLKESPSDRIPLG